jgi:ubiquinone/menaquinone biosynthesis C-methylase UbiE
LKGNDFRGTPCSFSFKYTVNKRLKFILKNFNFNNLDTILEVGCGNGLYLENISKYVNSCIGVDFSNSEFPDPRSSFKKNITFIQMSAENLAFKTETFDKILMIEAIEHFSNDVEALSEAHRVLKKSGVLVLTAPNKLFPLETHGMRIGSKMISSHGFGIPILPYLPFMLRKHITNANVYSPSYIVKLLENKGFQIDIVDFLMPNLDKLNENFPSLKKLITFTQSFFENIEKSKLRFFSETIIILARKV